MEEVPDSAEDSWTRGGREYAALEVLSARGSAGGLCILLFDGGAVTGTRSASHGTDGLYASRRHTLGIMIANDGLNNGQDGRETGLDVFILGPQSLALLHDGFEALVSLARLQLAHATLEALNLVLCPLPDGTLRISVVGWCGQVSRGRHDKLQRVSPRFFSSCAADRHLTPFRVP